ncbi:hypothetical protein [Clostridium nigeriense]|uniref:hypothetical protein n=1 Tax=Clostridium nigeriense TaxID=1805470 RepID=UPI000829802C|nr:hypothetical protein [Clostridium nigeriense]
MLNRYKDKFTVVTDGMHKVLYEDSSCKIELLAADVRDISLWVSIGKIFDKNGSNSTKLTNKQKLEAYKRVSAVLRLQGKDGVYTDEFKLIEVDIENIDYEKNILDIEE